MFDDHTVTLRGLAGVPHYDDFDARQAIYFLEFQPSPWLTLTQFIDTKDLEKYESFRGYIEIRANVAECNDELDDYRRCEMTVHDWRQINGEIFEWKQLNQD